MDRTRVESFSDGVFAFAITLLVLGIQVPDIKHPTDKDLASALLQTLSQLLPYLTSFATVGIIWLNHHSMFANVQRVKHTTLTWNLLLLLVVAFIPFPTAVLGRYGAFPSAVVLYGTALTALGLAYTGLWFHILHNRLSLASKDDAHGRAYTVRNLLGSVTYPAATLLAFVAPRVSLLIFFALAVFYLVPGRQPESIARKELSEDS